MTAKSDFLAGFTSEELELELEARNKPTPVRPPVILPTNSGGAISLVELAESYMMCIESGLEIDTTSSYELIMKLTYGDEIFDYINALT